MMMEYYRSAKQEKQMELERLIEFDSRAFTLSILTCDADNLWFNGYKTLSF